MQICARFSTLHQVFRRKYSKNGLFKNQNLHLLTIRLLVLIYLLFENFMYITDHQLVILLDLFYYIIHFVLNSYSFIQIIYKTLHFLLVVLSVAFFYQCFHRLLDICNISQLVNSMVFVQLLLESIKWWSILINHLIEFQLHHFFPFI